MSFPAFSKPSLHPLLFSQNYTVTVVDNKSGEPLIGATVWNTNSKSGTSTNADGQAFLENVGHRDMIEISYVGYQTQLIPFYELREKMSGLVKMLVASVELEVAVVIGRKDQPEAEIPFIVQRISKESIAFSNSQTAADVLRDNADVYIQKTQLGGGSPILRGFEANRVLLVLDGVRMNNAVYRNGHLQNSITLDNSILEQIEVIYGPGSLMYGSDALGGVVHYRTRDPKIIYNKEGKDFQFKTNAYTRFSSANKEKTFHVDLDYGTRRWGSLSSITYASYGDLTAGKVRPEGYPDYGKRKYYAFRNENVDEIRSGDPNVQTVSGYNQIDFLQKVKFQPNERLFFILNMQYSTSSNVPRYDNLTDTLESADRLKWAEWYYGPQQRLLTSFKMQTLKSTPLFDKAILIAAFQKIDEDLLKRKYRQSHRTFQLNDIYVYSVTGDFDKYLDKKRRNTFSYGFEAGYNKVLASAGNTNISNGKIVYNELTRYPSGGSSLRNLAGYANYFWKSRDSTLFINLGVRYTDIKTDINYLRSDASLIEWPEAYYEGITNQNGALTWGAGLTWNSKDNWQIRSVVSTAFRAPNLDDLAKIRPKNGFITIPNLTLKPENSMNYEITLAKQFGKVAGNNGVSFKLSGTGFYTELTDAIVRELGELPNGDSTMVVEGKLHTVHQNKNTGSAIIRGFSGNILFNVKNRILIKSGISFTKGRRKYFEEEGENIVIDTLVPLDHIPPLYGQTSIVFQTNKFKIEGVLRYNGAKPVDEYAVNYIDNDPVCGLEINREGMADNIEDGLINNNPAECQSIYDGLPSWITYNIYTSYQFNEHFSINLAVENIMDIHYRYFASTISAPGRNFILTFRGAF
jgi:hemoglobin/transferrin/lactoferrin receptor protein